MSYKICYLLPYFGKLPSNFQLWLETCRRNPSIDWLVFTDDKTKYNYPNNVIVRYQSYETFKEKIQKHFDFKITIDRPWKLCEFRPAYGEIFAEYLKQYDFWGHCDTDQVWGDIRSFITDDILKTYDKIGFQGHSTLYRNTQETNSRYKIIIEGEISYKQAFTSKEGYCFDENGICKIYDVLGIPYFRETNFAHLDRFHTSYFLGHLPIEEDYKNKYQVFVLENNKLFRYYLSNSKINKEEFMYLHFFSRPITYKQKKYSENSRYVAFPDVVEDFDGIVDQKFLKKYGRCGALYFYCKVAYFNRKKLTLKKIINSFKLKFQREKTREHSKIAVKSSRVK